MVALLTHLVTKPVTKVKAVPMARMTTKLLLLACLLVAPSCAIEPAAPVDPVAPLSASQGAPLPAATIRGNRALLVSVLPPLGAAPDLNRLGKALKQLPGNFAVTTVTPASAPELASALSAAARQTAADGTLVTVFTGFANDQGALTLPDGSQFGYASLLAAVGPPAAPFGTLATIVAASQGEAWVRQSKALDHARNFSGSIIATTVPRLSGDQLGDPGAAIDEMKLGLLHPAASRMFAVLGRSLEAKSTDDLETALSGMQKMHDQLYGPGPVVDIRHGN
ncbi:MAG: hypothetical protein RIQ81_2021 [Pseudomonadota bacterium]|jgi:hypothetical protein